MSLKCFLGFHDYVPVDGLYWKHIIKHHELYPNEVVGICTIKLYKCSKCEAIYEKITELYDESNFNLNRVRNRLNEMGIKHINYFYDQQ